MSSVYERVKTRVAEETGPWEERVLNGACASYDDYKHSVGMLAGATRVMEIVKEVLIQVQKEQEQ